MHARGLIRLGERPRLALRVIQTMQTGLENEKEKHYMDFKELIADFASRHNVADLVSIDGAASLDIDGIIVNIFSNDETVTLSAEVGEPPAEGAPAFANLLLEANFNSSVYFAKIPDRGAYLAIQTLPLALIDGAAFDALLESFVSTIEAWRLRLADFRPADKTEAATSSAAAPSFATNDLMQV